MLVLGMGSRLYFPRLDCYLRYSWHGNICAPFFCSRIRWFIQRGRHVSTAGRSRPFVILGDVTFITLVAALIFECAAAFIFGDVIVYSATRSFDGRRVAASSQFPFRVSNSS